MVDAAGTTKYAYVAGGQLYTEDGPFASDTVTNTYSNRLRTGLSLAQPTGKWTNSFAYDAATRLISATSPAGTFTYTRGGAGAASPLPKKIALPNTSYITNTYDSVARLTGTWLKNSSHTTLDSATYGYNSGHQRTTFTNASGTRVNYTYDPLGQLKVADSSLNSEDRGYAYDTAWNLNYRTNGGSSTTFSVDSLNQLTSVGSQSNYRYDTNGNLNSVGASTNWGYAYDDENQLVEWYYFQAGVGGPQNWDLKTAFTYDGLGRLRKRVEYRWNSVDSPFPQDNWLWATGATPRR